MKKKLIAGAVVAVCLALTSLGTIAYFTHEDTATNVITSGNIKIELQETALNAEGTEVPFENAIGIVPGDKVSKIVRVENTGDNEAFIRIKVTKAITLANQDSDITPDLDLVKLDFDENNWVYEDGYYYYRMPLAPGEKTAALFNNVFFDTAMGNEYQNSFATIKVDAQAVQVRNNGADSLSALGWPEME